MKMFFIKGFVKDYFIPFLRISEINIYIRNTFSYVKNKVLRANLYCGVNYNMKKYNGLNSPYVVVLVNSVSAEEYILFFLTIGRYRSESI